jgi:hypothetical protein
MLNPWDDFSKSYDENKFVWQLTCIRFRAAVFQKNIGFGGAPLLQHIMKIQDLRPVGGRVGLP